MWERVPLTAVSQLTAVLPVASGVDVVSIEVECLRPVTQLVAVHSVPIFGEHEVFRRQ